MEKYRIIARGLGVILMLIGFVAYLLNAILGMKDKKRRPVAVVSALLFGAGVFLFAWSSSPA